MTPPPNRFASPATALPYCTGSLKGLVKLLLTSMAKLVLSLVRSASRVPVHSHQAWLFSATTSPYGHMQNVRTLSSKVRE